MTKRKNILLLVHSFADPGGTQKLLCDLGKLLAERHNVFECSFDALRERHVFESGNTVLSLRSKRATGAISRMIGYAIRAVRLNRLKRQYQIDVTISNLWPADFANALSLGRGRKVSFGVVNVTGNRQNKLMLSWRRTVGWIYRRFDMTVSINDTLTEELAGLFKLARNRIATINAFVNLPDVDSVNSVYSEHRKRVVWFGRLHPMKNLAPLFAIVAAVKARVGPIQLVVIGDGPQRDELRNEARRAGLLVAEDATKGDADVVFTGFVADPYAYLKGCDLFVLTSRSEGFGLVMVEAMSVGLPVLASDCPTGGAHLILSGSQPYQHGRNVAEATPYGRLLPIPEADDAGTQAIWVDAITDMLTDDARRSTIASACTRRAKEFSRDRVREKWFALLETL